MKIDPKELIFRHYTSNKYLSEYKPEYIINKKDCGLYKPIGLWGTPSPLNKNASKFYTWKQWLENNDYDENSVGVFGSKYFFDFKIKENSKILSITNIDDIKSYSKYIEDYYGKCNDKIYKDYDGVFLFHGNDYFNIHFNRYMNCWDVDSIVIWNPEMIISIKEKENKND